MFDPQAWSRLEGVTLGVRGLTEGGYAGVHPARRTGAGAEFHDYRPYLAGDDPGAIDWKLFGRTDRYYLRRYQQESDLCMHVLLDVSASMGFAGAQTWSKLHFGAQVAAGLGFLAVRQAEQVSLALLERRLGRTLGLGTGWGHLRAMCDMLEIARPRRGEGRLNEAIERFQTRMNRRGLVVLISDLLDDPGPVLEAVDRLRAARCHLLLLQVLSPEELNVANLGTGPMRLTDPETGAQVTTDPAVASERYRQLMAEHLATISRGCAARGVAHHLLRTDADPVTSLRTCLGRKH